MGRAVKHLNLHRIGATELRVISDVDAGVLPIIQEEEQVIRGYMRAGRWSQRQVSLFILKDLRPLASQVRAGARLPAGDLAALDGRTVVNVYDLADPTVCHVFVNQAAMVKEGYWSDLPAIRGLLAHEHAHPLAENATTRASRQLRLTPTAGAGLAPGLPERVGPILVQLADQLCLSAPREICTNQLAIASGFDAAMLYLNERNIASAVGSLAGRETLRRRLEQEVAQGQRSPEEIAQLLLVGDLKSYLNLAIEVAPFYRAGRAGDARVLEQALERDLFPRLAAEVGRGYVAIRDLYVGLSDDLSPEALRGWAAAVLDILSRALGQPALPGYRLSVAVADD